ncbi:MAG TPA: PEP-CTERM sorting domain-containing protein, partial [Myxococcota bacterium]|nr:PEP-CTERM sorting domain-containing protein [Myxococcota bacterium]
TRVSSHYVIYDPTERRRNSLTITFDTPILGVMSSGKRLRASDWIGADGVEYRPFRHRRFERRDAYRISEDGLSVTLRMRANSPGDYFRIITEGRTLTPPPPPIDEPPPAVPEPGAALLFGAGAVAVRAFARQRGR